MKGTLASAFLIAATTISGTTAQGPSFKAGVDAVQVDASVTRGGRPVANLTADNFVVRDNGTRQDITLTPRSDVPLRVVLVLDTSDSVKGRRLQRLIDAGLALNGRLRSDDQVSLITFSRDVRLDLPMGDPGPRLATALTRLNGEGPTSLFDAVTLALASERDQRIRSLLLLFSDGRDTSSWMPLEPLMEAARRSASVIHVVRFGADKVLDNLARAAGGRTFSSASEDDLEALFTRALEEMRTRYVLTYTVAGKPSPGWHEIRVSLKDARGDVTARPGYLVP